MKGLDNGQNTNNLIKSWTIDKFNNENITFLELYEKTKIVYNIGVSNLTTHKFELFNYMNKPNLPIHLAISASVAIPIVYEPIVIDNELFCDGSLLESLPIEHINDNFINFLCEKVCNETTENNNTENNNTEKNKYPKVLSILLTNIKTDILDANNYKNCRLIDYIYFFMHSSAIHYINTKKYISKSKDNNDLIVIEIPSSIMTILKTNATADDIDKTINIGYETIKNKFSDTDKNS